MQVMPYRCWKPSSTLRYSPSLSTGVTRGAYVVHGECSPNIARWISFNGTWQSERAGSNLGDRVDMPPFSVIVLEHTARFVARTKFFQTDAPDWDRQDEVAVLWNFPERDLGIKRQNVLWPRNLELFTVGSTNKDGAVCIGLVIQGERSIWNENLKRVILIIVTPIIES